MYFFYLNNTKQSPSLHTNNKTVRKERREEEKKKDPRGKKIERLRKNSLTVCNNYNVVFNTRTNPLYLYIGLHPRDGNKTRVYSLDKEP